MHNRTLHPLALAAIVLGFLAGAMIGLPLLIQLAPIAAAPVAIAIAVALTVLYVRMGRAA